MDDKKDNWFDGLEIDGFDFNAIRAESDSASDNSSGQPSMDSLNDSPKPQPFRLTTDLNHDWLPEHGSTDEPYEGGKVISPFLPGSLAEHLAETDQPKARPSERAASIDGPFDSFLAGASHKQVVLNVRSIGAQSEGSERLILNAPRFAESTYLRIAAAYLHQKGDAGIAGVASEAKSQDCPLWKAPRRGLGNWRTIGSMARLCRQLDVAVWHSHDYHSNLLGRLISRVWKMKLVSTIHHWPRQTWRQRLAFHVDQWGLSRFDHLITVSPQLRDNLVDRGFDANRVDFIATGIDTAQFQREHDIQQARIELGVSPQSLVVGVVARFTHDKGVDRAIKTIAELRAKFPNIELHLVGDGPEYNALKELARQQHVADRTHFWGWQSPTQRFYELMDVLLVPSRAETTPMVVLEAMAMGVPVAATKVGNVPELLKGGRRGVLLSNRHHQIWPDHLAPLLISESRRQELARQGRRRVEKYFSFDRTMHQIMSVYDRVLSINSTKEATAWRRAA